MLYAIIAVAVVVLTLACLPLVIWIAILSPEARAANRSDRLAAAPSHPEVLEGKD